MRKGCNFRIGSTYLSPAGIGDNVFSFQLKSACALLIGVANLISVTLKTVFLNNN